VNYLPSLTSPASHTKSSLLSQHSHCICFNDEVTIPRETIWPIEPHTAAKHQILRKYLDAWFPILGTYHKRIVYVDGFSGPGRYAGGEPGSPLIALESARTHRANLSGELVFLFIEERSDRADHLEGEVAKLTLPLHFKVIVERGSFPDRLGKILDNHDSNRLTVPIFALIDPFGFSAIPYTLITQLLARESSEVLITFMVDSINRWLTHPDQKVRAHIVNTFGTDKAATITEGTGDRATALKNLYHRQLNKAAKFVRYFELRDKDSRVVYYLFFASNNPVGHLKMKEAMWKVDPLGDFTFSDSTDPQQQILFTNPSVAPLALQLRTKFRGAGQLPVQRVEMYVRDESAYLRKHMREAMEQLETGGQLKVAQIKTDGKNRRARTYPNDALVTFS
jgi:three-Cys-motif partner protein